MVRQIIWSSRANEDLESNFNYIARDSKNCARIQVETIVKRIESLREFPLIGRSIPEFSFSRYREVIAGNDRVIYRYDEDRVFVIAVTHSRRLIDTIISERNLMEDFDV